MATSAVVIPTRPLQQQLRTSLAATRTSLRTKAVATPQSPQELTDGNNSVKENAFTPTQRQVIMREATNKYRSIAVAGPGFATWQAAKNAYFAEASSDTHLLRLDCMNPPKALEHLSPSTIIDVRQARQLSITSQDVSDRFRYMLLAGQSHSPLNPIITTGVRDAILATFHYLHSITPDRTVWVPSDVYPTYFHLASQVWPAPNLQSYPTLATSPATSASLLSFLSEDHLGPNDVLLMPSPLSPLGRPCSETEVDALMTWLSQSPSRTLILDAVYDFDMSATPAVLKLLSTEQCVACWSMAKGWVSPDIGSRQPSSPSRGVGVAFTGSRTLAEGIQRFAHQPSTDAIAVAMMYMDAVPDLPHQLQQRFRQQWERVGPRLSAIVPDWHPPATGYFSTVDVGAADLLDEGVFAVPSSVFGGVDRNQSVITCLYDVKNDDIGRDEEESSHRTFYTHHPMMKRYYVTALSNFARGFDKYSRRYDKDGIKESTFSDKFYVLPKSKLAFGIKKVASLLKKTGVEGDEPIILETEIPTVPTCSEDELLPNTRTNIGQYLPRSYIVVKDIYRVNDENGSTLQSVEEAMAKSLRLSEPRMLRYEECTPRTVSVLPVAIGCQAKCPFCFSHSSVSNEQQQKELDIERVKSVFDAAAERGASRAVITGGGEPTMLPSHRMLKLIRVCAERFPQKVVMITNGYSVGRLDGAKREKALRSLLKAGLTVLAISRHGYDDDTNKAIMHLDTRSDKVAKTWRSWSQAERDSLTIRWVCVLQKGGVEDKHTLYKFLDWAASSGVNEICFKELYVSTSLESVYHDSKYNKWSAVNQVPLKLLLDFADEHQWSKVTELPWGSPVFEGNWNGHPLRIAAYTEPSLFWERSNGLLRSWNLLADGNVYASLEDKQSALRL